MEHTEAMEAALRWHPEWRDRRFDLDEEDDRHLVLHIVVESLLASNERFASIAKNAERQGVGGHAIRHCLGSAYIGGMWYHSMEGTGYDPEVMAQQFRSELQNVMDD
jgi:hypothetical protein